MEHFLSRKSYFSLRKVKVGRKYFQKQKYHGIFLWFRIAIIIPEQSNSSPNQGILVIKDNTDQSEKWRVISESGRLDWSLQTIKSGSIKQLRGRCLSVSHFQAGRRTGVSNRCTLPSSEARPRHHHLPSTILYTILPHTISCITKTILYIIYRLSFNLPITILFTTCIIYF